MNDIKVIAFDADDTLWENETLFQRTKDSLSEILAKFAEPEQVHAVADNQQMRNLPVFGYGSKAFTISMIETAMQLSEGSVGSEDIQKIIVLGKQMQTQPVELLDGIEGVLQQLQSNFKLMMITKGDLVEQEHKITNSGLSDYFENIEILSEKNEEAYSAVLKSYGIDTQEFMMVGNSVRSDILPVVNIGAQAVHIPFRVTWAHEVVDSSEVTGKEFLTLSNAKELLPMLLG